MQKLMCTWDEESSHVSSLIKVVWLLGWIASGMPPCWDPVTSLFSLISPWMTFAFAWCCILTSRCQYKIQEYWPHWLKLFYMLYNINCYLRVVSKPKQVNKLNVYLPVAKWLSFFCLFVLFLVACNSPFLTYNTVSTSISFMNIHLFVKYPVGTQATLITYVQKIKINK